MSPPHPNQPQMGWRGVSGEQGLQTAAHGNCMPWGRTRLEWTKKCSSDALHPSLPAPGQALHSAMLRGCTSHPPL